MCLKYQKTPDDPFITDMDPVLKLWMYNNWITDQEDKAEITKNHAYLIGSFHNPEAVQKMMNDNNVHASSDDDFEESTKIVKENAIDLLGLKQKEQPIKKRKRRTLKG